MFQNLEEHGSEVNVDFCHHAFSILGKLFGFYLCNVGKTEQLLSCLRQNSSLMTGSSENRFVFIPFSSSKGTALNKSVAREKRLTVVVFFVFVFKYIESIDRVAGFVKYTESIDRVDGSVKYIESIDE